MIDNIPFDNYNELEVLLPDQDKFLCVVETLSRIGIGGKQDKTLFQSVHILHRKGKYYLKHFKEMMCLDGKRNTVEHTDIERRNRIAMLLDEWKLVEVIDKSIKEEMCPMSFIRIVPYKDKENWSLNVKYQMGKNRK